ncbi:MAG: EscI/YscI/HrpB family type III secretion system inner rod protein [Oceanospirillales bacterium LUC14_002_19_P2]|nr:MAG: EscI/YscI/HrpB family type III secretion system inner rod protein [Oceanospirillales bacterium LUC14_002_19_P2]
MTTNINGVGGVTEKGLQKSDEQDLEQLKEQADSEDTAQFDALMNEGGIKSESETNVAGEPVVFKEAPANAGDKILNAFMGMKDNIETRHSDINKMLGGEGFMSMKDMINSQRAITNLTMTEDLIAKIVGKATQNIDTLMKQQ